MRVVGSGRARKIRGIFTRPLWASNAPPATPDKHKAPTLLHPSPCPYASPLAQFVYFDGNQQRQAVTVLIDVDGAK